MGKRRTMLLNCTACGEQREMTEQQKSTGTGPGCLLLALTAVLFLVGLFFWPLWLLALVALVGGIYYIAQSVNVWVCPVCKGTIQQG